MPVKTMAQCMQNNAGGFTIKIKESVYEGAYKKHTGAFLGFICHEICHLFLFHIGFTPIYSRSFEEGELPSYRSAEWQAKALCGEVMIPYEESRGMGLKQIQETYQVSEAFAIYRRKQERIERGMSIERHTLKAPIFCLQHPYNRLLILNSYLCAQPAAMHLSKGQTVKRLKIGKEMEGGGFVLLVTKIM